MRADGKVNVEIVGPPGSPALTTAALTPFGGEVDNTWRHRVEAWIPVEQLSAVARTLPPGYIMERVAPLHYDDVNGEGPGVVNSAGYRNGGANGSGKTIAVIDGGYDNLTEARANGDAPSLAASALVNYTGNAFEEPDDGTHGTGCVEAAYDHCPGATGRIYKINSLTDMGTAVDNAIANGVDVISHSLSRYNLGWNDNEGDACAAANGILFFTSAGNRADQHWQGNFSSPDADGWHDYVSGDETIDIDVPSNQSVMPTFPGTPPGERTTWTCISTPMI
jgi:hypothetical protein